MLEAQATEAQRGKALGWKDDEQFGRLLAPSFEVKTEQWKEALEILSGYRWPPRIAKDAAKVLSLEISRTLALRVDVVLWWTGERFAPAFFCKDATVAPYLYILTHKGIGVCPHCGEWFQRERRDQVYCSIAHREAHRVARWRARKSSLKTRKKGDEHVTRKTR